MQLVALAWFVVGVGAKFCPQLLPCSSPEVRGGAKCN